jgi:hypothetical protein
MEPSSWRRSLDCKGDHWLRRQADVRVMFCSNCGALLGTLASGCLACGTEPAASRGSNRAANRRRLGALVRSARRTRPRRPIAVRYDRGTDGETPLLPR